MDKMDEMEICPLCELKVPLKELEETGGMCIECKLARQGYRARNVYMLCWEIAWDNKKNVFSVQIKDKERIYPPHITPVETIEIIPTYFHDEKKELKRLIKDLPLYTYQSKDKPTYDDIREWFYQTIFVNYNFDPNRKVYVLG